MANTTKEKILEIAGELSDQPDALFTTFIAIAAEKIKSSVWGACQQLAQSYWCAHYITEIRDANGGDGSGGAGGGATGGAISRKK